ncbi:MAG TPA: hypothetical protein DEH78_32105 [Solibacterales bacterium]|nr:hypothetical protein [Bryobacterales bacterium]
MIHFCRYKFETALLVFRDPFAVSYVDCHIEGEERWHTVGLAGGVALVLVVHTVREEHGEEEVRIISARKAGPGERSLYKAPDSQGTSRPRPPRSKARRPN